MLDPTFIQTIQETRRGEAIKYASKISNIFEIRILLSNLFI